VRLELLERIYETIYTQRIRYGSSPAEEAKWPHRILTHRSVTRVEDLSASPEGVKLYIRDESPQYEFGAPVGEEKEEVMDVDAVFVATGYMRNVHEELLSDARGLMKGGAREGAKWEVSRDYQVQFAEGKVSEDAGVWLQGCCESTHGVSRFI
jgi:L-ornithine N5-oxygenase